MESANVAADAASVVDATLTLLSYIGYAVVKVLYILFLLVLSIAKPIWNALQFVLLPITYIGAFVGYLASLPIKLIVKLEAVYIFFGIAIIIGLVTGVILHFVSRGMLAALGLSPEDDPPMPPRKPLRTVSSYRASRQTTRRSVGPARRAGPIPDVPAPSSPLSPRRGRAGRQGLQSSTILEEDDSVDGTASES
ncbi:hypothetical protein NA57DRAFT_79764 [Rhizodiscina lignyota]|uniref:Uncharacterized protein n=1 Tax=Rhizodiscina lignyota TaxID=1504668 RepID=A0A9P4M334_9PEZI|nr:hypothetical protein NA57DRAFT_79764 [Rhizodiscina lignyota]